MIYPFLKIMMEKRKPLLKNNQRRLVRLTILLLLCQFQMAIQPHLPKMVLGAVCL